MKTTHNVNTNINSPAENITMNSMKEKGTLMGILKEFVGQSTMAIYAMIQSGEIHSKVALK